MKMDHFKPIYVLYKLNYFFNFYPVCLLQQVTMKLAGVKLPLKTSHQQNSHAYKQTNHLEGKEAN